MDRDKEMRELVDNIEHHYISIRCMYCRLLIKWVNPVLYLAEGKEIALHDHCKKKMKKKESNEQ